MNTKDLIHNWANSGISGVKSASSITAYPLELYSYSKLIAKHFDNGVTVISDYSYSTTTSKHQSIAKYACSHLETYLYSDWINPQDSWEQIKPKIAEQYLERINDALKTLSRARSGIECKLEYTFELIKKFKELDISFPFNPYTAIYKEEINSIEDLSSYIETTFKRDLAEITKQEKEKEKAKQLKERNKALENLEKWRKGEFTGLVFSLPPALKVVADTILTSHGASLPLDVAKEAYKKLLSGEDITGLRLNNYTIDEVTESTITIGCHKIPREEIKNILS